MGTQTYGIWAGSPKFGPPPKRFRYAYVCMALKPDRFCHPETHTLNHSYQVFTIVSVPNVIVFCDDPKMPIWRVPRNCSLCEIITENWLAYIFPPGLIDTVVLISILQK